MNPLNRFRFRMDDWFLYALVLTALIAWLAPQQLGVSAYKMSLNAIGGLFGYWLDRSAFPYARPDNPEIMASDVRFAAAMQRRAIIMGASILAAGLGA